MTSTVVEDENQDDARDKAARLVEANEKLAEAMVALATIMREAVELIRGQQGAAEPAPPAAVSVTPPPSDVPAARPVEPGHVQLVAPAPDESLEMPTITIDTRPVVPLDDLPFKTSPPNYLDNPKRFAEMLAVEDMFRSPPERAESPPPSLSPSPPIAPPAFDLDTYVPPAPSSPESPFNRFRAQLHGPLQVPVMGDDDALPSPPPPRPREYAATAVPDPSHSDTNVRDAPPFIAESMGNQEPQYDVLQSLRGFTDQVRSHARVTVPIFENITNELAQYNSRLEAMEMGYRQERTGGAY
jgi:hypothetical protein